MRKQCRRKIYKLINPIEMAIEGASITPDKILKTMEEKELQSIKDMMTGNATLRSWQDLVDMNNVCQQMGRDGIGPECLVDCMIAEMELKKAAKRYEKTKKMGLTAQGIRAIQDVFEWHTLQRKSISRSEYELQIKKTLHKLRSRSKEVTVIE